jgi:hypothetical protein
MEALAEIGGAGGAKYHAVHERRRVPGGWRVLFHEVHPASAASQSFHTDLPPPRMRII